MDPPGIFLIQDVFNPDDLRSSEPCCHKPCLAAGFAFYLVDFRYLQIVGLAEIAVGGKKPLFNFLLLCHEYSPSLGFEPKS
jgi:hypothetical protein